MIAACPGVGVRATGEPMRDERGSARPSAPPTRAKGVFINNRWPAAASGKPSAAVAPAGGKVFTAIVAGGEAGPPFNTLGAYRRRTMGALALLLLLAADAALGFFGFGRCYPTSWRLRAAGGNDRPRRAMRPWPNPHPAARRSPDGAGREISRRRLGVAWPAYPVRTAPPRCGRRGGWRSRRQYSRFRSGSRRCFRRASAQCPARRARLWRRRWGCRA